jgi:hypothetical protein
LLIESGASVNATRQDGVTALCAAACCGHTHICIMLLAYNAAVDQVRC